MTITWTHFLRTLFSVAAAITVIFHVVPGSANELMQRIEETGIIRIGFQEDVTPFSSFDEIAGTHTGFSVDMAHYLVYYLSKRFDKNIKLVPINLKANQRIPMIVDGRIDIEMGASTQTFLRENSVDFSLVYFASESTFLVSRTSEIFSTKDLTGKRIAAGKGTTNLQLLKQLSAIGRISPGKILEFDNHNLALWALTNKNVDAYCADRVLLTTKQLQTQHPENWIILEDSIGYEPYAFMIPENNSDFRDFVNDMIRWTLLSGTYFDIYERWMGPLGVGPFKMPPSFKEYLNVITYPLPDDWWKK